MVHFHSCKQHFVSLHHIKADDTWGTLSNFAGKPFLSNFAWALALSNKIISGYFRSAVGSVWGNALQVTRVT